MLTEDVLKRPILLTEKASRLREQNQVVFEVHRDANKIQIRDAVQKMFKVTVVEVRTSMFRGKDRRMGRGVAKLQNWKKAVVQLKAGDTIEFFDESTEKSELEDSHADQDLQTDLCGAPFLHGARHERHHQDHPRARPHREEDELGWPQQQRAHHVPLPRRRTQAALPRDRFSARQDRCSRERRGDRVRPEPHLAHRAPPLRRRREALHPRPRRNQGRRQGGLEPQRRHQAGQLAPAPSHPARHSRPQRRDEEGQGRSARPLRRRRRDLDGEGRRLRAGPSPVDRDSQGAPRLPRDDRAGLQHRPPERVARQSRSLALARKAPAQPRRHDEPGRSPDGWRRRPHERRSSPLLAVGPAREGQEDAQQQAHRFDDRPSPWEEGFNRCRAQ